MRSQPPSRVSSCRTPGPMRSAELDGTELPQLLQPVTGVDAAHGARLRPHHQRLCGGTAAVVADAPQELAVGDAGGREEAVVAGHEVVGGEHLVEVVAALDGGGALAVVAGP